MKKFLSILAVSSLAGLASCGSDPNAPGGPELMAEVGDLAMTKRSTGTIAGQTASGDLIPQVTSMGGNVKYHGGPVMTSPINVYLIWYGNWGASNKAILTDLVSNIGSSPYWKMNTAYTQSDNKTVSNTVSLAGQVRMTSEPAGNPLYDHSFISIVGDAINGKNIDAGDTKLPLDANGMYFVLTTPDVKERSGYCATAGYCGFHSHGMVGTTQVKYAFVGDPSTQCPANCLAQNTSPNGSAGVDTMASNMVNHLNSLATDPVGDGWWDNNGYEISDKCAYTYGTKSTAANGSKYNMTLGSRQYLIQQNWKLGAIQVCAMK